MPEIKGIFLFCDDVREETGGKASLIGLLGNEATVETLPGLLSKLAAVFLCTVHGADRVKAHLTLEVIGVEDLEVRIFEVERDFERPSNSSEEWSLRINLVGPVPVAQGSKVRATCRIGDFSTASTLLISQVPRTE